MASFHSGQPGLADPEVGVSGSAEGSVDEMLAPVIAGAYARGVAETLDLLGLPGLFLDRSGEVIFASRAAAPLLRGPLRLHMRHLVAEGAEDNRQLATFVADAVGAGSGAAALHLPGAAVELRCLPRTAGVALPGQLVHAVVLLLDDADPRHAALAHRPG